MLPLPLLRSPRHRAVVAAVVAAAALLTALSLSGVRPAHAQAADDAATAETADSSPGYAEALRLLAWSGDNRGAVLIAVAPDVSPVESAEGAPSPSLPPLKTGGHYSLNDLKAYFGCALLRLGTVDALGPAKVEAYNLRPGRPILSEAPNDTDKQAATRRLLASLNKTQWRQIASKEGLGVSDLSQVQRTLWEQIVPDPLTYSWGTGPDFLLPTDQEKTYRLTDAQRRGVRLHVKLITSINARMAVGNNENSPENLLPVLLQKNYRKSGIKFLSLEGDALLNSFLVSRDYDFGQPLVGEVPHRPKSTDLAYTASALDASVSLATPTGDSANVKELIARIGTACGIELYVDQRLGELPVVIRTGGSDASPSARAGDVLAALAWGVAGAVRRLGPDAQGHTAYVLTRDVVPVGAQQARVEDWFIDAERQASDVYDQDRQRIVRQDPIPLLSFDDDELVVPSSDLRARVIAAAQRGGKRVEISPKELTPEQQKILTDSQTRSAQTFAQDIAWEGLSGGQGISFNFRLDRVFLSFAPWLGLIVPNVGEITTDPLESLRDWFPPAPAQETPLDLAGKTLAARVATEAEATDAVAEAARIKAAVLWLEADPPVLAAAIKAGKAAGIPVGALLPLLTRAGTPDINLLGEDSAAYAKRRWNREGAPLWCAPDDPAARTTALKRVREEAAIPGLAVLVLRDALPPGYRDTPPVNHDSDTDSDPISYREGAAATLGYSLEHRLAFLREKGIDPADLVTSNLALHRLGAPWSDKTLYEPDDALTADWDTWRQERGGARTLLTDARAAARAAAPNLPLILAGSLTWRAPSYILQDGASWFISWSDAAKEAPALFPATLAKHPPAASALRPKSSGTPVRLWLALGGPDTATSPTDLLRQSAKDGWDGYVLDLCHLPWPDAQKHLKQLAGDVVSP